MNPRQMRFRTTQIRPEHLPRKLDHPERSDVQSIRPLILTELEPFQFSLGATRPEKLRPTRKDSTGVLDGQARVLRKVGDRRLRIRNGTRGRAKSRGSHKEDASLYHIRRMQT